MTTIKDLSTAIDLKSVVTEIIKLRKKYKVTQKDLAAAVGVSQAYISRIENGDSREVSFDLIVKILGYFGLEMFTGKIESK